MNKPLTVAKLMGGGSDPEKHYLAVNDEYVASAYGVVYSIDYDKSLDQVHICIHHEGQFQMSHFWCDEARYYPAGTDITDTMEHLKNPVQPLSVQTNRRCRGVA